VVQGRTLGEMLGQWDLLRRRYLEEVFVQRLQQTQEEHRRILAALKERDEERVARLISEHNRAAFAAYARHLELAG
jgi:DNA-binding GntR family transcriptional regulator